MRIDRSTIAAALDGVRVPELVLSLRRACCRWMTVLTYHRVARAEDAAMLDEGVVDATPEQLDRQLAFVTRWFDVVRIADVVAYAAGGPLPNNPLLVTFDDGYRDNHDAALPILTRHGVHATFFVATDYIERRRPFWWDRLSHVVKRSKRDRLFVERPVRLDLPMRDAADKRAAITRVQRIVKDRRGLDLDSFVSAVEHAAGVTLSRDEERRLADQTVMTWEHVSTLRRSGMDVQSHTRTHRVLQTLDRAEVDRELRGSREDLERVLGERVRAVSYPVGRSLRRDPEIRSAVRNAGYELGFSNATGVNRVRAFDPLDARRVSMDAALSDSLFRTMLALPGLAW